MGKIDFKTWMNQLKCVMECKGLINIDTVLDDKGYKPYWEEGLDIWSTLDAEFGKGWRWLAKQSNK